MNNISTMNSLAGFHDTVQQRIINTFGEAAHTYTNALTMMPAAQITRRRSCMHILRLLVFMLRNGDVEEEGRIMR
ncbi:MAG: hypothetical protein COB30_002945 [Ectothiorhodospiraceae bacterium]|nr:hypothetical protein [Ectothiorhodospiraceae bacterium]